MKKSVKIMMIVALALILAGGVLLLGGCVIFGAESFEHGAQEYREKTYDMTEQSFENIWVQTNVADVSLLPSTDDHCRVVCYESNKMYHTVEVKNGTLVIRAVDSRKWYDHIGLIFEDMKVTIYLPASDYATLQVDTDTGKITVPSGFAFSSVTLESDTGAVEFGATSRGTMHLCTDTGAIRMSDAAAQRLQVESDTGSIRAERLTVTETMVLESDTGSIELHTVQAAALQVSSDTSAVRMEDVIIAGNLSIETHTGGIELRDSDAQTLHIESTTGSVYASLLTPKICYASSDTGKVDVPQSYEGGRCEVETDTGSIYIEFPYGTALADP
ncbi:MAG: DUF4097 family beta strand repeat protein [Clostridia bacterium]|nr:DUF4097 family beta strand repeat protein [Clostridia bacterium]